MTHRVTAEALQLVEGTARTLGVELLLVEARVAQDLDEAFAKMATGYAEALLVIPSVLAVAERRRIVGLADRHRLPAMYWQRDFVELGGLMAYGANVEDLWRRGATYVDKILKGAKPADLAIRQPVKFDFLINLKTAKALGVAIPPALLVSATELID